MTTTSRLPGASIIAGTLEQQLDPARAAMLARAVAALAHSRPSHDDTAFDIAAVTGATPEAAAAALAAFGTRSLAHGWLMTLRASGAASRTFHPPRLT